VAWAAAQKVYVGSRDGKIVDTPEVCLDVVFRISAAIQNTIETNERVAWISEVVADRQHDGSASFGPVQHCPAERTWVWDVPCSCSSVRCAGAMSPVEMRHNALR
jgi:hypothetical protein